MRLVLLILVALTLFSGCAGLPTPEESHPSNLVIRNIKINTNVHIVDKPFVQAPASVWGGAIGELVGGTIVGASSTSEQRFVAFLEQNSIDLKKIFVRSFEKRLSADSPIVLSQGHADAELEFHVLVEPAVAGD